MRTKNRVDSNLVSRKIGEEIKLTKGLNWPTALLTYCHFDWIALCPPPFWPPQFCQTLLFPATCNFIYLIKKTTNTTHSPAYICTFIKINCLFEFNYKSNNIKKVNQSPNLNFLQCQIGPKMGQNLLKSLWRNFAFIFRENIFAKTFFAFRKISRNSPLYMCAKGGFGTDFTWISFHWC